MEPRKTVIQLTPTVVLALLALLLTSACDSGSAENGSARETASGSAAPADPARDGAVAEFNDACVECHTVPDPAIASDTVWLAQIMETS